MKTTIKIYNDKSLRHIDENGFLFVEQSPILKSGILEYYGAELTQGTSKDSIDGVYIDNDKLYKVYISNEELEKSLNTFKGKPIVNEHKWLGKEGENAKDYQEGNLGEQLFVKDNMLFAPLYFNNIDTIDEILNGFKTELSASYENNLIKSNNKDYDFIATDIKGNHVALVENGRCGAEVRVYNSNNINNNQETMRKTRTKNSVELIIDDKKIDLDKFISEESNEGDHEASIQENEEVNMDTANNDKRAIIDEIGGMLKDKVDEELWRTIIGKLEQIAYTDSEASANNSEPEEDKVEANNEDIEEKTEANNEDAEDKAEVNNEEPEEDKVENKCSNKAFNSAAIAKLANSIKKQLQEEEKSRIKSYNMAKSICGDFDFSEMSEKEILTKALNNIGINIENEDVKEMKAMIKAYNSSVRVDNSFNYNDISAKDTVTINY